MSKIRYVVIGKGALSENELMRLRLFGIKRLLHLIENEKEIIFGRWGTNKRTLKKLLKGE